MRFPAIHIPRLDIFYATGRINGGFLSTVEVYNPTANTQRLCFAKMSSRSKMAQFSFATTGIRSLHSTKSFCQDPEGFFWAEMWARLRRGYA